MSTVFQNYPLVQKALEEQEGIARFLGETLPEEFTTLAEQFVQTAEAFLDGSHEEKEAVMIGCILLVGSPFIFDDTTRFETEYTPQVEDVVDTILTGKIEGSALMQQALAVIAFATSGDLKDEDLARIRASQPAAQTKDDLFGLSKCPLLKETAPRLYAALEERFETLLSRLNPKTRKPFGPGPHP